MVLAELGTKLNSSLKRLQKAAVVDDSLIDECLKEITTSLLEADVNVRHVAELRGNVKKFIKEQLLEEDLKRDEEKDKSISRREQRDRDQRNLKNKMQLVKQGVVRQMVRLLTPGGKEVQSVTANQAPVQRLKRGKLHIVMFVGLQGGGKTTTCTKFAHYYKKKGWKVALVCVDTFRAGAFDQLKQNAAKARIPFYGSYTETDPVQIATDGLQLFQKEFAHVCTKDMEKDNTGGGIVIIDTSGRHKQEGALFEEMRQIRDAIQPTDIVFVMDSHLGQACYDQAKAFKEALVDESGSKDAADGIGSVVITKLDGHAKGGGALSAVAATGAPIAFIGTGEHLTDFELFDAESFVSRLLGLGDLRGLVRTLNDSMFALGGDDEEDPDNMIQDPKTGKMRAKTQAERMQGKMASMTNMMDRMSKGQFTLRDLSEQFRNMEKMGPLSQVMSMIPGFDGNALANGVGGGSGGKSADEEIASRMRKFQVIMDSMSNLELDGDGQVILERGMKPVPEHGRGRKKTKQSQEGATRAQRSASVDSVASAAAKSADEDAEEGASEAGGAGEGDVDGTKGEDDDPEKARVRAEQQRIRDEKEQTRAEESAAEAERQRLWQLHNRRPTLLAGTMPAVVGAGAQDAGDSLPELANGGKKDKKKGAASASSGGGSGGTKDHGASKALQILTDSDPVAKGLNIHTLPPDQLKHIQYTPFHARVSKLARGAGLNTRGRTVEEIHMLLAEYKRMAKMVGKLGKSGMMANPQELMKNPAQAMKKMQGLMSPDMMKAMGMPGGMGGMPGMGGGAGGGDMMKNMMGALESNPDMMNNMMSMMGGGGGGGGMPDMSEMMSAMGGGGGGGGGGMMDMLGGMMGGAGGGGMASMLQGMGKGKGKGKMGKMNSMMNSMFGGGGEDGMPDMAKMQQMAKQAKKMSKRK